jgi:hypothetical protein
MADTYPLAKGPQRARWRIVSVRRVTKVCGPALREPWKMPLPKEKLEEEIDQTLPSHQSL